MKIEDDAIMVIDLQKRTALMFVVLGLNDDSSHMTMTYSTVQDTW